MYNSLKSNIIHPVYVYKTQNTNFQIKKFYFITKLHITTNVIKPNYYYYYYCLFSNSKILGKLSHIWEMERKKMQENKKKMKNPLFNILWNGHKLH